MTRSWLYWTILAILGLVILILNDAFGEKDFFVVLSLLYFIILIVSLIRWSFLQIKSIISLKRDKIRMEMLHLKSQVSPHFFFNTLNNLYGLVEKNPQKAKTLILKLSDLMRYSLYEGQNDLVSLTEEVQFIRNYIDLHQDRYHKRTKVEFEVDLVDEGVKIMPLILILLVENAFKHGVEKLRNDAKVYMKLSADQEKIVFRIENNFDVEDNTEAKSGIGLQNLKRRLEIGYPRRYKLDLSEKEGMYRAHLKLDCL